MADSVENVGSFAAKFERTSNQNDSLLCVGLDPDPDRVPLRELVAFHRDIIGATRDVVCAYKPNLAFYEALGIDGLRALGSTMELIPQEIPVIGDGKRGDVPHTAAAYARAMYDVWGFDAVTVNPYLGWDSIEPFARAGKTVFLVCHTSNAGARDVQELGVRNGAQLFEVVAERAAAWSETHEIGLVLGGTFETAARSVRTIAPDLPLLVLGIGAQGAAVGATVRATIDSRGAGAIFSSSRAITYASNGVDRADAARAAAIALRDSINAARIVPSSA